MSPTETSIITVDVTIQAPIDKVWTYWTTPQHIRNWNFAIDEWHCPSAQNELIVNGSFNYRMEAKDGSMGFDFAGTYDEIIEKKSIGFSLDDGRKVKVTFIDNGADTQVVESFEPEKNNPTEMQQMGWQSILNNFKKYAENN